MHPSQNRAGRLMRYLADVMVNGPLTPIPTDLRPPYTEPTTPPVPIGKVSMIFKLVSCLFTFNVFWLVSVLVVP